MLQEIERIGETLNEDGIRVENVWGIGRIPTSYLAPFLTGSRRRRNLQRDCKNLDAVITLYCVGRRRIFDKSRKPMKNLWRKLRVSSLLDFFSSSEEASFHTTKFF